ncbi:MAG TPA: hypothetical protein VD884_23520 [Ohtaekwangia sp.]|nr:hypothetical protein [Ohtaekwangia sp.]
MKTNRTGHEIERPKTSLEIDEDINLHVKGWIIQRVGWFIILILLVCAAIGLFGTGVLSEKTLIKEGSVITYEQFNRRENETHVEIVAREVSGNVLIHLPHGYLQSHDLKKITPEPAEYKSVNGSLLLVFPTEQQAFITLDIEPKEVGQMNNIITINQLDFGINEFIFP